MMNLKNKLIFNLYLKIHFVPAENTVFLHWGKELMNEIQENSGHLL
jgi:hypothetical protein